MDVDIPDTIIARIQPLVDDGTFPTVEMAIYILLEDVLDRLSFTHKGGKIPIE